MNNRPTVLVAEDDPVFRRVIAFSIEAAGLGCQTAANGLDAKAILADGKIDLLVTDHQMPLCSGLELIEYVRSHPDLAALPIILCTAKGFELNATELSRTHRLLAVMRKPFSPRQMIGIVTAHLQGNSASDATGISCHDGSPSTFLSCPPATHHA